MNRKHQLLQEYIDAGQASVLARDDDGLPAKVVFSGGYKYADTTIDVTDLRVNSTNDDLIQGDWPYIKAIPGTRAHDVARSNGPTIEQSLGHLARIRVNQIINSPNNEIHQAAHRAYPNNSALAQRYIETIVLAEIRKRYRSKEVINPETGQNWLPENTEEGQ